jgi:aerobic-type carbon monoxide dehydrogenase small subunit (CoxS/CutS family)
MQCGYCTPGFVTTAKALLDRNPNPTEEEIVEALGGNLCRCGTYPQHPKAIREAAGKLRRKEGGK